METFENMELMNDTTGLVTCNVYIEIGDLLTLSSHYIKKPAAAKQKSSLRRQLCVFTTRIDQMKIFNESSSEVHSIRDMLEKIEQESKPFQNIMREPVEEVPTEKPATSITHLKEIIVVTKTDALDKTITVIDLTSDDDVKKEIENSTSDTESTDSTGNKDLQTAKVEVKTIVKKITISASDTKITDSTGNKNLQSVKAEVKTIEVGSKDSYKDRCDTEIYTLDKSGNILGHYNKTLEDVQIQDLNAKTSLIFNYCCWYDRDRNVDKIFKRLNENTWRRIKIAHKCVPGQCECCCKPDAKNYVMFNVDDYLNSTDIVVRGVEKEEDSVKEESVVPEPSNVTSSKWIEPSKVEDSKSATPNIEGSKSAEPFEGRKSAERANVEGSKPVEPSNDLLRNLLTRENKLETLLNPAKKLTNSKLVFLNEKDKLEEYEADTKGVICAVKLDVSNFDNSPSDYGKICCWYSRENLVNKLREGKEFESMMMFVKKEHMCPVGNCGCCCKPFREIQENFKFILPENPLLTEDYVFTTPSQKFLQFNPILNLRKDTEQTLKRQNLINILNKVDIEDEINTFLICGRSSEICSDDVNMETNNPLTCSNLTKPVDISDDETLPVIQKVVSLNPTVKRSRGLIDELLKKFRNISLVVDEKNKVHLNFNSSNNDFSLDEMGNLNKILKYAQNEIDNMDETLRSYIINPKKAFYKNGTDLLLNGRESYLKSFEECLGLKNAKLATKEPGLLKRKKVQRSDAKKGNKVRRVVRKKLKRTYEVPKKRKKEDIVTIEIESDSDT